MQFYTFTEPDLDFMEEEAKLLVQGRQQVDVSKWWVLLHVKPNPKRRQD